MDAQALARPFQLTPSQSHPFLTLGDYFEAIRTVVLRQDGKAWRAALQQKSPKKTGEATPIDRLRIRSEKHGALYHIARVDVFVGKDVLTFAVSVALSETARKCLKREDRILNELRQSHPYHYLPAVYSREDLTWRAPGGARETFTILLSEWFEGFYEWHIARDPRTGNQGVKIWDSVRQNPLLTPDETYQLFKEVSKILTLYYDPETFRQIYPWHHAAGDFVVSHQGGTIQARLITARKYHSIMHVFSSGAVDPIIATVYFFLNLTIRTRLDRVEGIGDTVWVEDTAVEATIRGFADALQRMQAQGRFTLCAVADLMALLRSFGIPELKTLFQSLCGLYMDGDAEEYAVIQAHLNPHVRDVYQALRSYPG